MAEKKIALVTGASSGIGELTAERLCDDGWRVFGSSRNPQHETRFEPVVRDLGSSESVQRCVDDVLNATGHLDPLVNNAGSTFMGLAQEMRIADAKTLFEANFFGHARLRNAVLPSMQARRKGRIVYVSSLTGLIGFPGQAY